MKFQNNFFFLQVQAIIKGVLGRFIVRVFDVRFANIIAAKKMPKREPVSYLIVICLWEN